MKLIVISTEKCFDHEAAALNALFAYGLDILHLRKPAASENDLRQLLQRIDSEYLPRIVLHDCHHLANEMQVRGVHLNSRSPLPPMDSRHISKSLHSLAELEETGKYDYVFLSPIFDSISKTNYHRAFTEEELLQAHTEGQIGEKTIALGGISEATIPEAARYGFGGVAVLGSLWGNFVKDRDVIALIRRFQSLLQTAKQV